MISTKQKRIIALLVIVITLVNVGALATVLFKLRQVEKFHEVAVVENTVEDLPNNTAPAFMMREIGFDKAQWQLVNDSKRNLKREVAPLLGELRELNADLTDEVMQKETDTLKLRELCENIGSLHAQMKLETMHHLLDIKQIASPEQSEKLKGFYREMLSRGDGSRPDGRGHRHRKGWRNTPQE